MGAGVFAVALVAFLLAAMFPATSIKLGAWLIERLLPGRMRTRALELIGLDAVLDRAELEQPARHTDVFDVPTGTVLGQAADDVSKLVGDPPLRRPKRAPDSPTELIREIARLRDEALITEEEFQAKKADPLSRL